MQHLTRHNILCPLQHGFREKRSCETQLIEFIHDIAFNMQKGVQNDVVVMDFAKAFDKVAHNRLLFKLSSYGVKGNTLGWIGSFLSGRSQKVVLEGKSSTSAPVLSGVPQGSVLGPALFLIYINDLQEYVSNSTVRLFADDTLLFLTIYSTSDCIKLQEDLDNLERWESDCHMSFHPEKCEVIHITTKKKPILHKYTFYGHTLSSVPQIKYLGVHISNDLKWNSHINSISSKANQTLGFLKRNLKISSPTIKEKAYKSIVRPKLEYCNTVWDPKSIKNPKEGEKSNQRLVQQVEMVQRRAARWVTGRYHNTSSVSDMFRSLDWRSLEQRRVDSRLTILYKLRNHLVAIDENKYLQRGTGRRDHQYRQFRADKDYTRFSFFPRTVIQWNQLPRQICRAESLDTFKTQVAKIEHSRLN